MSRTGPDPGDSWRRLVARALVFHEAAAERLGINATDLKCLELAVGEDEITPTRLAELTGLTSGAITGVLDRLERRGIVRREADPDDRRRVVVRVDPTGPPRSPPSTRRSWRRRPSCWRTGRRPSGRH